MIANRLGKIRILFNREEKKNKKFELVLVKKIGSFRGERKF